MIQARTVFSTLFLALFLCLPKNSATQLGLILVDQSGIRLEGVHQVQAKLSNSQLEFIRYRANRPALEFPILNKLGPVKFNHQIKSNGYGLKFTLWLEGKQPIPPLRLEYFTAKSARKTRSVWLHLIVLLT